MKAELADLISDAKEQRIFCAGCGKQIGIDFLSHPRGIPVLERGLITVRVCADGRVTDSRWPKKRSTCVRRLVAKLRGHVDGLGPFQPADIAFVRSVLEAGLALASRRSW